MKIERCTDYKALGLRAAQLFRALTEKNIAEHGMFRVALSGGHTPQTMYAALSSDAYRRMIPWEKIEFFWSDERYVPLHDPENNAGNAEKYLLSALDPPPAQIFLYDTALPPADCALDYEQRIRKHFTGPPRFDLIFLGLGPEGHTASLFPGSPLLAEKERLVKEVYVPQKKQYRLTFTLPLINAAAAVCFLVSGVEKAQVIRKLFHEPSPSEDLPASLVKPVQDELIWILDEDASRLLK